MVDVSIIMPKGVSEWDLLKSKIILSSVVSFANSYNANMMFENATLCFLG
jgi:hypothetical protein